MLCLFLFLYVRRLLFTEWGPKNVSLLLSLCPCPSVPVLLSLGCPCPCPDLETRLTMGDAKNAVWKQNYKTDYEYQYPTMKFQFPKCDCDYCCAMSHMTESRSLWGKRECMCFNFVYRSPEQNMGAWAFRSRQQSAFILAGRTAINASHAGFLAPGGLAVVTCIKA